MSTAALGGTGRLAGKRVVVTGAAGGIGAAICRRFCDEGAHVLGADLPGLEGPGLLEGLASYTQVVVDVTSEASVQRLRNLVEKRWGGLDVLVNNAGAMVGAPLLDTTLAELERVQAVNVTGPFLLMRALAPLMGPDGSIVNMSSSAAARPVPNMGVYAASKAAISMLSKVAALELTPVRVNTVLPGAIDTAMPRRFVGGLAPAEQKATLEALALGRLAGRLGQPDEVAALVLYLASAEASFVTGADFIIDGGRK